MMLDDYSEGSAYAEHGAGTRFASPVRIPWRAVRRALEYVHSNLAGDVHLVDIARAAGLSTFHFARVFKKATGIGPHRYLMWARVQRVKELLVESDYSLAAIADEAGFSDQSHMNRVFRRSTGTTPRRFRDARINIAGDSAAALFSEARLMKVRFDATQRRWSG